MEANTSIRVAALQIGGMVFKSADSADELAQIHDLNYLTFVREIGQHADPGRPALVDKFHDKNLYLIAKRDEQVVGMLAVHDRAPFSVAERMPEPNWIEKNCRGPLEVRLLTVRPGERQTLVLPALFWMLHRAALAAGYSHLLASGVREQLRLYYRMGFQGLGPERPCGRAWFTPLALDIQKLPPAGQRIAARIERLVRRSATGSAAP